VRIHFEEPMRRQRLGLSLQLERVDRLCADGVSNQAERLAPDQCLAGCRRLLQTRRNIDRVASDKGFPFARNDLACVDADADLELEERGRPLHLRRGTHRPQCVILVSAGHPEDGHDCVADELLHRPTVPLDDRPHLLVVAAHQPPQWLRVDPFSEFS
jgi:hypothetical protein